MNVIQCDRCKKIYQSNECRTTLEIALHTDSGFVKKYNQDLCTECYNSFNELFMNRTTYNN